MSRPAAGPWLRGLQGLALSPGSPLGWLALQWFVGADPLLDLARHPGVYLYMQVGTTLVFTAFGAYVGHRERQYRDDAMHDALTGLYNTRHFWRRLADDLAFAQRHGRPLTLLIGDLDRFKAVNDRYGHAIGDRVLKEVSGALLSERRRGDTIARVGGEEFAIVLSETGSDEALAIARRMADAVRRLRFELTDGRAFSITLSIGVASVTPGTPATAEDLYRLADRAMYAAKDAGRDRVASLSVPADGAPALASNH